MWKIIKQLIYSICINVHVNGHVKSLVQKNFVCFYFITFPHRFCILKVTLNIQLTLDGLMKYDILFKNLVSVRCELIVYCVFFFHFISLCILSLPVFPFFWPSENANTIKTWHFLWSMHRVEPAIRIWREIFCIFM